MGKKSRTPARSAKRRKTRVAEVPLRGRKAASVKGGGLAAASTTGADASDPSGNTIYTGTAGVGVWKQKERIPFKG